MMKLGIFGGTFDPPHVGHLILASESASQLGLDQVLWVLTPDPPHKQSQPISPLAVRLEMTQAAIAGDPQFVLSRVEIDRPPPHYAADTMRLLRQSHPQAELTYLMGGDSLRDLPLWRTPAAFIAACDWLGVMRRPGHPVAVEAVEQRLPGLTAKLHWVDAPWIEISASAIRQKAASGGSYRHYLPPAVYAIVRSSGLYLPA